MTNNKEQTLIDSYDDNDPIDEKIQKIEAIFEVNEKLGLALARNMMHAEAARAGETLGRLPEVFAKAYNDAKTNNPL